MRGKYNNRKTVCRQHHTHDSMKEAYRCNELHLMLKGKRIKGLDIQYPFVIQKSFKHEGKTVREIKYIADFVYNEDGKVVIEDVKGALTQVYKLKKKLLLSILNREYQNNFKFIET